jgi:hypothetical protein
MSVYPRNPSNFSNCLSGYNKNNVKLTVLGSGSAQQGEIIQVNLPSNSIVDVSSLAWSFQVVYGTQTAAGACNPPINCEGLISRLAVEVNGQTLVKGKVFNKTFDIVYVVSPSLKTSKDDPFECLPPDQIENELTVEFIERLERDVSESGKRVLLLQLY